MTSRRHFLKHSLLSSTFLIPGALRKGVNLFSARDNMEPMPCVQTSTLMYIMPNTMAWLTPEVIFNDGCNFTAWAFC